MEYLRPDSQTTTIHPGAVPRHQHLRFRIKCRVGGRFAPMPRFRLLPDVPITLQQMINIPERQEIRIRIHPKVFPDACSPMPSKRHRNYILVMLFWKYMSDVWRDHRETSLKEYKGDEQRVARRLARERFQLPDGCDFLSLYNQRNEPDISERMNIALAGIEEANKAKLEGVFREVDFNSENKLGQTRDRNTRLKLLLQDFAEPRLDLRPSVVGEEDVIGNVYEYLLERFASDAGKKAGEFYTPGQVSSLLARLLAPRKGNTICDPTCGSGSLLIKVGRQADERDFALFGHEMNGTTHALCRMNMFLHGMDNFTIAWGDTLRNPRLVEGDQLMKFDIVVANPPFSLDKWGYEEAAADSFHRYHRGLPPKSKGDWGFITHMIETAREGTGRVGVVVPHGVLFRGAAEGKIRQKVIEENLLEAVIGLPANLFFGTGIHLNIPRYVGTFEEEAEIDLDAVKADITRLESELATVRARMQEYLEELGV